MMLSAIYHPTSNRESENIILRPHVQRNLDNLLVIQLNARVIITGDFNRTSTGLKLKDLTQTNHLIEQLVTFKTRNSGIPDWFVTNQHALFELSLLPKIASSDHLKMLAKPFLGPRKNLATKKLKSREMRDSAWHAFGRWTFRKDWNSSLLLPPVKIHSIFSSQ